MFRRTICPDGINTVTQGSKWKRVPYISQRYYASHDVLMHSNDNYLSEHFNNGPRTGDVEVRPVRCEESLDALPADGADDDGADDDGSDDDDYWWLNMISATAAGAQKRIDETTIYRKQNKVIPILHIWDVVPQYGSVDHVNYSWNLDEMTKECKLEIDQSDKIAQGKKAIKFSFATNDTDKLVSHVVDGYEVKYMLHTDAIRFRLDLDIIPLPPYDILDFNSVCVKVKLEFKHDGKPYTIDLPDDQHPSKKPKLDHSNNTFKLSCIRIIPRNLRSSIKLTVTFNDSTRMLPNVYHQIFPYHIPVDQQDLIPFENGYITFNVFWSCSFHDEKGFCTEVCTCEPGEFIGFPSLAEVSCSRKNEE